MNDTTTQLDNDYQLASAFRNAIGAKITGGVMCPCAISFDMHLVPTRDDGTVMSDLPFKTDRAFNRAMGEVILTQLDRLATDAVALLKKRVDDATLAEEVTVKATLARIEVIKRERGLDDGNADAPVAIVDVAARIGAKP